MPERIAASVFLRRAYAIHAPTERSSGNSGYTQTASTKARAPGLVPESKAITDSPATTAQTRRDPKAKSCEITNQIKVPVRRFGVPLSTTIPKIFLSPLEFAKFYIIVCHSVILPSNQFGYIISRMDPIQTEISEVALVKAIRGNLYEFFRSLARKLPSGDGLDNSKFTRWQTPLRHPWFNGLVCKAPFTDADIAFIQESIQYFTERRVGTFTCWLDAPQADSGWKSILATHGFGFSNSTPGMAIDLEEVLPRELPATQGVEIRTVDDESALQKWSHIFTLGYGLPPDWEEMIFEVWSRFGLDFPLRNYLGYLNGEPVSTSSVFYGRGVAGIYDVATLPQARSRGIGTALTLAPLLDARQAGYRIGILQSSEMGFGVYKKMGFRHLCQIENFFYQR